jgi:hypothetical protein
MVDYEPPMEQFRSAFLPTCATTVIAGSAGALAAILIRHWPDVNLIALAVGLAFGAVAGAVFTYVAVIWFPVYIGPSGIRSYNVWGLYRTVPWADVTGTGRLNILGLRYISLKAAGRGPIYVPLFLSGMDAFRARVLGYAGPFHPVASALGVGRALPAEESTTHEPV